METRIIQVRLDRGTCNNKFLDLFPDYSVEHVMTEESDHLALFIKARDTFQQGPTNIPRGFKYEEMWRRHEGYEDMVVTAW